MNVPHLGGSFPGSIVVNMLLIEVVTHGWELARAVGQPWQPDEATAARALAFYQATIKPEWRACFSSASTGPPLVAAVTLHPGSGGHRLRCP